jgi:hypothetical protein
MESLKAIDVSVEMIEAGTKAIQGEVHANEDAASVLAVSVFMAMVGIMCPGYAFHVLGNVFEPEKPKLLN